MPASKNKPFLLDHCWKILQNSEKWKLSLIEPNKKNEVVVKDDDDGNGGRNLNKPEGNKKAKLRMMKEAEAALLREKLDQMVHSNESMVAKTLEARQAMAEKKSQEKRERSLVLRDEGLRKDDIERRRVAAEENKSVAKLLAEENKIMMMNRAEMDPLTLEWHDILRKEILHRRKQALLNSSTSCGGDGVDGGGDVDV